MKRNGFSLIELMIAVAIMAILAAVLLPMFKGSAGGTHELVCQSDGAERVVARSRVVFTVQEGLWYGSLSGPRYLQQFGEMCWDRKVQVPQ